MIPQVRPGEQVEGYRIPGWLAMELARDALARRRRSFACDAQRVMGGQRPAVEILGGEQVPDRGGCLLVCNHYSRPGLPAWWFVLAVSDAVAARRAPGAPVDVHWVMTAAWTFPESRWRRRLLTPATRWAFGRLAGVYDFVTMPPMPSDPGEVEARAAAVRRTLHLAHRAAADGGMVGLAPEGRDVPGGLGEPPKGAGSFLALLAQAGLPVVPVGIGERGGRLRLSFGAPFAPQIPAARAARDGEVARQVMAAIARQVGEALEPPLDQMRGGMQRGP